MSKDNSINLSTQFYEKLRKQIRRFDPYEFSIMASNTLGASLTNMKLASHYPPHFLLQAIEDNCLFFDPHVRANLDRRKFDKVINIYHSYTEPYHQYELDKMNMEGVFNFLLSMARNQFPIQRHLNFNIFARSIILFHESDSMEYFRKLFQKKYGLPIKDWLILTLAIFSWLSYNKTVTFKPDNFRKSEIHLPIRSLEPFLKSTSQNRKEISDNFDQELRKFQQPYLRLFARSSFFDFPFLRFSNTYVNPHPNLLSYLAHERIYKIMSDMSSNEFQTTFGKTFEEYLDLLLKDVANVIILKEKEIRDKYDIHEGEVCDFLVEFPDCFLLIEAKAVQYTTRILNLELLHSANSSKKIAKAHDQLISIGKAIAEDSPKSKLAICVTYGQMYFPNFETYYQKVIIPNMKSNFEEVSNIFEYPPQTLSIDEFEDFIAIVNLQRMSPIKLFNEMGDAKLEEAQSWHNFLYKNYRSEIESHKSTLSKNYYNIFVEKNLIQKDFKKNWDFPSK